MGAKLGAGFVVLVASLLAAPTLVSGRSPTAMCGCFGPVELPLDAHLTFDGLLLGLLLWTLRLEAPPSSGGLDPSAGVVGGQHQGGGHSSGVRRG